MGAPGGHSNAQGSCLVQVSRRIRCGRLVLNLINLRRWKQHFVCVNSRAVSLAALLGQNLVRLDVYVVQLLQGCASNRRVTHMLSALPDGLCLIENETILWTCAAHRRGSVEYALRVLIEIFRVQI